jgi:hypothetical protein
LISGSRVLEIDPQKNEIVWQYSAANSKQPGWAFYSSFISSARRLPNGNTLIDEGMNGRFFQVRPTVKTSGNTSARISARHRAAMRSATGCIGRSL